MKNFFLLIFVFFFLAIFQVSFLAHFSVNFVVPNLVLILVCLISFFEKTNRKLKIISSIAAGFFIDIYSGFLIGISIVAFLIVVLIFKKMLRSLKYSSTKYPFLYFLPLFIFSIAFYNLFLNSLFAIYSNQFFQAWLGFPFLTIIIYNACLASGLFFIVKLFLIQFKKRR